MTPQERDLLTTLLSRLKNAAGQPKDPEADALIKRSTVTAPLLSSIAVVPSNPSIAKGLTQQFMAMGHYTDGTSADITSQVTWSSDNTGVATVAERAGRGVMGCSDRRGGG